VIEGEAGPVGAGVRIGDWPQVAGRYAGLEDQIFVGLRDASAVVEDG
jgi:hypothetical protein